MGRLTEWWVLNTKNKSYSITAEVEVPEEGRRGRHRGLRGITGGLALYAKGGKPNFFRLDETFVEGEREIPAGTHQVGSSSPTSAAASQRAGRVTLFVDGKETGPGHFERTQPFPFSGDEAFDLGSEFSSLVTTDYGQREFSGQMTWAEIELGLDDHDHLISPEERLNLAMAIQ
jgi:hypothetical protein